MACQSFHEAGEYSSFVEVRDNVYFPSWLREIVRTRRVQRRDGQWFRGYGSWVGDGGDAGRIPQFLLSFGLAVLGGKELQDIGQVRCDGPSERATPLRMRSDLPVSSPARATWGCAGDPRVLPATCARTRCQPCRLALPSCSTRPCSWLRPRTLRARRRARSPATLAPPET